ncbi:MAG: sigma-70 family RNA polymerase sigma factor [Nocardioidaceae bacterium]
METRDALAVRFEEQRLQLRGMAYRMLGSLSDAEDAVQEVWLRLDRQRDVEIRNLAGWLATVTGRVCLDQLRARAARGEHSLWDHLPDPVVTDWDEVDPEHEALVADSVGLALMVVLDTLSPAERVAFVLHDVFGVPFEGIAGILARTESTTRKLASRARAKVQDHAAVPDTDLTTQRAVVEAFLAAARDGDLPRLAAVLAPDVVARADWGPAAGARRVVQGSAAVASEAVRFARLASDAQIAVVNGTAGIVVGPPARPMTVLALTVRDGIVVEIDIFADQNRLSRLLSDPKHPND